VFRDLETVVVEVSKGFRFMSSASRSIMDIQKAMFLLPYHVGMEPMMKQFFTHEATPMFCRYYLASLARIPQYDVEKLIREGLVEFILDQFCVDRQGKIYYFSDSIFTLQMAEALIGPDNLNLPFHPPIKNGHLIHADGYGSLPISQRRSISSSRRQRTSRVTSLSSISQRSGIALLIKKFARNEP
jgi:hypothetical protein